MIKIIYDGAILKVQGHAGYAPDGQDIVCAAISTLTITLINSMASFGCEQKILHNEKGLIEIEFTNFNNTINILVNAYLIGVVGVSEEYPEYVEVMCNEAK